MDDDQAISQAMAALARRKHAAKTPEERSAAARKLAQARWGKKKTPTKTKAASRAKRKKPGNGSRK